MIKGEINQDNLYLLLPSKVSLLSVMLQKHEHISMVDAIKKVYQSDTYHRLENESSKMWHLGPVALYEEMVR